MDRISYFAVAFGICSLAGLTSCVDDKYDLSDVDTTVKVSVNDLVIPLNLDKIELSSILDLKEDDKIQVVNGVYAATETGSFTSSGVSIAEIHLPAPHVAPTTNTIFASFPENAAGKATTRNITYKLHSDPTSFDFTSTSVSEYIKGVDNISCELDVKVTLSLPAMSYLLNQFTVKDLTLQLPMGLECTNSVGGTYDPVTGILSVSEIVAASSTFSLRLNATRISADDNEQFNFSADQRTLAYHGEMSVLGGTIIVTENDLRPSINFSDLPHSTDFGLSYVFSDITVNTFTGQIEYPLEDVNVSDVNLDNLPDVLAQPETNLVLANPQIFLSITNPLNTYRVYAQAGMTITPIREGVEGTPCSLDDTGRFDIGRPYTPSGTYTFLLSPTAEGAMEFAEYPDPTHIGYTSLSRILAGEGLPDKLAISLDNPSLPLQTVTDFTLGGDLGAVVGEYRFVAPLQFGNGSRIVYTDTQTGWNDEDLDHITIQSLSIDLNITSELPLGCVLRGYPIDIYGHQINNVEIEGAVIPALAKNADLTIRITGEITHLDGIYFEAVAEAENDNTALSPDLTISLNKVRPRVSGYYEKEL